MSRLYEAVTVKPVWREDGGIIGYKGNLKVGDAVRISKNPALSVPPVDAVIVAENKWHYTAKVKCPEGKSFNLSLNKQSLYAKDPRYISEVADRILG